MTFKEIVERQRTSRYGRIKRESDESENYITFDEHLTALNKDGTLKTFTNEELDADDWEIY